MKQKPKAKPQGSKGKNTKPKAGLSFSEKKRLKELQRTLAGNHKEQEKPTTAQNTITFKKMFRDGICQVTSEFYTKMVEFYQITYDNGPLRGDKASSSITLTRLSDLSCFYLTGRSTNRR